MWKPDVGVPECYIYRSGEASKQFDKRAAEILQSRTRAARGTPGSPLASPLPDLVPLPSFSPSSLPVLHSPVVRGLAADPARNVHNNDALPDATRVPRALYLQNSRSEPQLRMPLIGCVGDAMIQERQRSRRKKEDPEPLPGIVECRMNLDAFRRAAASSAVVVAGCIQDPIARTIAMRIARAGGVGKQLMVITRDELLLALGTCKSTTLQKLPKYFGVGTMVQGFESKCRDTIKVG
eukprot:CAMPEP_0203939284 /NCGR_PEP_ID=MMETSP0359-20131031/76113_1 /ASSEMBLY_ACC=CAM_ASM_000338 /TAXON_ID=268821 /ORGANISM="Scrippsiella Hangoei, Strain SHTV-5" /LENGTH=236 /DNA_ID=CAMNT_0050869589 /DNA_START=45 /DNA_END=750 /DNA_ORIENTATION=-